MNDTKNMRMQKLLRGFADDTTMHGVPRIIHSKSLPLRIFWTIICIGAFVLFIMQATDLLQRYWKYPKKVNMEIIQKPVPFPSVSVCNTDHLDLQVVDYMDKLFFNPDPDYSIPRGNVWLRQFNESYEAYIADAYQFMNLYLTSSAGESENQMDDMMEVNSRLGLVANMGWEMASRAGIKLEDFIVTCQFLNKGCGNLSRTFRPVFDPYYFNCYTFQPEAMLPTRNTRLQGVEYGLSLLLYSGSAGQLPSSDQYAYIVPGLQESNNALASGKGARVVVHSPYTRPHPTAQGYDIAPGFSVNIGVKARENERIGLPHGNCSNHINDHDQFNYTLIECQNACMQHMIMQICGCIDNRFPRPLNTEAKPFCYQLPDLQACSLSSNEAYMNISNMSDTTKCLDGIKSWKQRFECRKELYDNLTVLNPGTMDECNCYPPCHDMIYDSSYSLSTLPEDTEEHSAFYSDVSKFLENFSQEKKDILRQKYGEDYEHHVVKDLSRLNVHIADGNIVRTTEKEDYEAIRLVSDIGGQLGLWIGISVITIFEVLQLLVDMVGYVTSKGRTVSERKANGRPAREHEAQHAAEYHDNTRTPYWDLRYTQYDYKPQAKYEIDKLTTV